MYICLSIFLCIFVFKYVHEYSAEHKALRRGPDLKLKDVQFICTCLSLAMLGLCRPLCPELPSKSSGHLRYHKDGVCGDETKSDENSARMKEPRWGYFNPPQP